MIPEPFPVVAPRTRGPHGSPVGLRPSGGSQILPIGNRASRGAILFTPFGRSADLRVTRVPDPALERVRATVTAPSGARTATAFP